MPLVPPHDQGLNDSVRAYRSGQFLQTLGLKHHAWLHWIGLDCVDSQLRGRLSGRRGWSRCCSRSDLAERPSGEKGRESLTQRLALLLGCFAHFPGSPSQVVYSSRPPLIGDHTLELVCRNWELRQAVCFLG